MDGLAFWVGIVPDPHPGGGWFRPGGLQVKKTFDKWILLLFKWLA